MGAVRIGFRATRRLGDRRPRGRRRCHWMRAGRARFHAARRAGFAAVQGICRLEGRDAAGERVERRLVECVPRSGAFSSRGGGGDLQPDRQDRRGQLPGGARPHQRGARRPISDRQRHGIGDARFGGRHDVDRRGVGDVDARRLGRGAARDRGADGRRGSERRQSGQRLARGAVGARPCLYPGARGGLAGRPADEDCQGIQALAHDHTEPVQRRHRGEVRRDHRAGAGAQRSGPARRQRA